MEEKTIDYCVEREISDLQERNKLLAEIERLRAGLEDVRTFLNDWGGAHYMEGAGIYEDRDSALSAIAYALGEIP